MGRGNNNSNQLNTMTDLVLVPDATHKIETFKERCMDSAAVLYPHVPPDHFRIVASMDADYNKSWRAAVVALPTNLSGPGAGGGPSNFGNATVLKSIEVELKGDPYIYSESCRRTAIRALMFQLDHDVAAFIKDPAQAQRERGERVMEFARVFAERVESDATTQEQARRRERRRREEGRRDSLETERREQAMKNRTLWEEEQTPPPYQ